VATHFSRLLRHAWVTVGLFLFPGHHTGKWLHLLVTLCLKDTLHYNRVRNVPDCYSAAV